MDEKLYLRVLQSIDDISLLFNDKDLENFDAVNNLRVGLLHLICLEELHKDNFNRKEGFDLLKIFETKKGIKRNLKYVIFYNSIS